MRFKDIIRVIQLITILILGGFILNIGHHIHEINAITAEYTLKTYILTVKNTTKDIELPNKPDENIQSDSYKRLQELQEFMDRINRR